MAFGRIIRIILAGAMTAGMALAVAGTLVITPADAATTYSTTANLNVRSGPSTGTSILTTLPRGAKVTAAGSASKGWLPVTYNGKKAYVSTDYLKKGTIAASSTKATVTTNINFRTRPSLSAPVITVLGKGLSVTTDGRSGDFTAVTVHGRNGWVYTEYLSSGASARTLSATTTSTTKYLTGDDVRVRTQPGLQSATVTTLDRGTKLTVTGAARNGFAPVSYKGVTRWVSTDYLSATAPKARAKVKATSSPSSSSSSSSSRSSSKKPALNLARAAMWDRIARCESGNRWNINTGNGYYGGLQFNLATWRGVGGEDFATRPDLATRAEQITVANRLYAQRGLQPWTCRTAA